MRLYKSKAGCVAVCADTHESVAVGGHHLSAIQALNKRCGVKHRKEYNVWEEVRVAQNTRFVDLKIRGTAITERNTVEQLNNRVYGR
jgi:hypothetical protein